MTVSPEGSAWNPGIKSQIPWELRPLSTIFRPENISNTLAAIDELRALTGLRPSEVCGLRVGRVNRASWWCFGRSNCCCTNC